MADDQFRDLVKTVEELRNPNGGCPWDLEQTHLSLEKYLEEETQEVIEVLETFRAGEQSGDYEALEEELGDVLLQVLLHSQIASEAGKFSINDVVTKLNDKLIRRHPHVFGESDAKTVEDVERQWEKIKAEEKLKKDKK